MYEYVDFGMYYLPSLNKNVHKLLDGKGWHNGDSTAMDDEEGREHDGNGGGNDKCQYDIKTWNVVID